VTTLTYFLANHQIVAIDLHFVWAFLYL